MLYTSGTTGWPKGVMLTQRSMTAHTRVVAPAYAMDESTVNVVAMPLFHVGGTSWALGSMSAGGRTIIVREPVSSTLLCLIESRKATHAYFVAAMVQVLLADPARARSALRSLKVLAYGGSSMPAPANRAHAERLADVAVLGVRDDGNIRRALRPRAG